MRIGIIGCGNMGAAIAERIKTKYQVSVFDKDQEKINDLKNIQVAENLINLVGSSDAVMLAVKPQDLDTILNEIKDYVKNKLIISIAAGITTGYLERSIGKVRVIRVMPNIGVKISKSVTCICKGSLALDADLELTRELFNYLGKVLDLPESMMNAATAISGSGPGYYFSVVSLHQQEFKQDHKKFHRDFIKDLQYAAESLGFDSQTALFLAQWTVVYSDLLLKETKLPAEELKKQVTSRGGTTEAALEVLHRGGSMTEVVMAAVKRAQELSK